MVVSTSALPDAVLASIQASLREDDGDLRRCGTGPCLILSGCLDQLIRHSRNKDESTASAKDLIVPKCRALIALCDSKFYAFPYRDVPRCWRRLYTDSCITMAIAALLDQSSACDNEATNEKVTLALIRSLDLALIIAGAPGEGRQEAVLSLIAAAQVNLESRSQPSRPNKKPRLSERGDSNNDGDCPLPAPPAQTSKARAKNPIPELPRCPDLLSFVETCSKQPFIIRSYASDWPALSTSPGNVQSNWSSGEYLARLGGKGRVVPVEIGGKYTEAEWGQGIVPWEEFLTRAGWLRSEHPQSNDALPPLYLAQHTLLTQFPDLASDMILPDYLYACPPAPAHMPEYRPPVEEDGSEDFLVSAWIGPAGTESPAHTDPYYNCYVQVVGYKQVWIAPPDSNRDNAMNSFGAGTSSSDAETAASAYMSNTSRVDVFERPGGSSSPIESDSPFATHVEPRAMSAILGPGDLLFFPPGWWHSMLSLTRSFSVSMWF